MEDSYRLELSLVNFKDSRRHQQPENAFYLTLSDARRINANTRVKKSALCTKISHSPSSTIKPTAGRRGRHITNTQQRTKSKNNSPAAAIAFAPRQRPRH